MTSAYSEPRSWTESLRSWAESLRYAAHFTRAKFGASGDYDPVLDDYDPRKPEYLVAASQEEQHSIQSAQRDAQITRLRSFVDRHQCKSSQTTISHYQTVLENIDRDHCESPQCISISHDETVCEDLCIESGARQNIPETLRLQRHTRIEDNQTIKLHNAASEQVHETMGALVVGLFVIALASLFMMLRGASCGFGVALATLGISWYLVLVVNSNHYGAKQQKEYHWWRFGHQFGRCQRGYIVQGLLHAFG